MTTSNVICNTTTNVKASAAPSAAGMAVVGDVTGSEVDAHVAILSLIPLLAGCGVCVCVYVAGIFSSSSQTCNPSRTNKQTFHCKSHTHPSSVIQLSSKYVEPFSTQIPSFPSIRIRPTGKVAKPPLFCVAPAHWAAVKYFSHRRRMAADGGGGWAVEMQPVSTIVQRHGKTIT